MYYNTDGDLMRPPATFTRVSEKGQATIPADIRSHLDIQTGDYVAYEINEKGQVILSKARINIEPPKKEVVKRKTGKKAK